MMILQVCLTIKAALAYLYTFFTMSLQISAKLERYIVNGRQRQINIQNRKREVDDRMKENVVWLERVDAEIKLTGKDDTVPEVCLTFLFLLAYL